MSHKGDLKVTGHDFKWHVVLPRKQMFKKIYNKNLFTAQPRELTSTSPGWQIEDTPWM